MEVLIVGAGAVGRWFASLLDATVAFTDVDPEAARSAAASQDAKAVEPDTAERFDAVTFAVPIPDTVDAIETHADKAASALIDLTGVMGPPVDAMTRQAPDRERLSLHPLFAPENAPGRVAVVKDAPGELTESILAAIESGGNGLVETTPAEHDRAMETVQAKAHAAVLAFALAAEPVPDDFGTPVYDGLMQLVEEVTEGNPRVYADIQSAFDGADDVAAAAERIAAADPETFEGLFRDAGR